MAQNLLRKKTTTQNGPKKSKMDINDLKWSKVDQNVLR